MEPNFLINPEALTSFKGKILLRKMLSEKYYRERIWLDPWVSLAIIISLREM